ncbi:uncharacterized protein LOC126293359 [Schistocerca gregaria]|uniref:uncharacterized protein LOC126293359 n=1 Tax=Schistocerca gregaria TaxID=7010 RepID=UPI00211DBCC5|nr:uncharacterized protein LOC126293359 [Schistocerca gregaria]
MIALSANKTQPGRSHKLLNVLLHSTSYWETCTLHGDEMTMKTTQHPVPHRRKSPTQPGIKPGSLRTAVRHADYSDIGADHLMANSAIKRIWKQPNERRQRHRRAVTKRKTEGRYKIPYTKQTPIMEVLEKMVGDGHSAILCWSEITQRGLWQGSCRYRTQCIDSSPNYRLLICVTQWHHRIRSP